MLNTKHPCNAVQEAIDKLDAALCDWERDTSRKSVVIIREEGGFVHRTANGRPDIPDDITDCEALAREFPKGK